MIDCSDLKCRCLGLYLALKFFSNEGRIYRPWGSVLTEIRCLFCVLLFKIIFWVTTESLDTVTFGAISIIRPTFSLLMIWWLTPVDEAASIFNFGETILIGDANCTPLTGDNLSLDCMPDGDATCLIITCLEGDNTFTGTWSAGLWVGDCTIFTIPFCVTESVTETLRGRVYFEADFKFDISSESTAF